MKRVEKTKISQGKRINMGMVLIANSSQIQRRFIQRMMIEAGHSTMIAETGVKCVDLVGQNENKLDCVLLDSHISSHRAVDVLESIKTLREDLPVVILAAGRRSGLESSYCQLGADGVVSTPTDRDALLTEVDKAIRNRPNVQSSRAHLSLPSCSM